jgi:hypothetical protein
MCNHDSTTAIRISSEYAALTDRLITFGGYLREEPTLDPK